VYCVGVKIDKVGAVERQRQPCAVAVH
jgi:hypothetical protein